VLSTALGLMTIGDLPRVAAGVALRVGFDAPKILGFQVTAAGWPRRDVRDETGAGARFAAYELAAALCPRAMTRDRLELVVCGGVRLGAIHARGLGLDATRAATRPRALADLAVGPRVRLAGPVWLVASAGASVPLVRDRFAYGDAGSPVVVHRPWPLVPTFELGIALRSQLLRRTGR
jgi:hypothetical protein